jgi:glucan phosphoethanolaminetransferase (alkaline phosphatase superfamily)
VKPEMRRWRFGVVALLALVPSAILIWQGIVDHTFTDAEIAGGAPEDVLGFGFWTIFVPVGTFAAFLLFWTWCRASRGITRAIAAAETALFLVAAIFATWSYALLKARVFP